MTNVIEVPLSVIEQGRDVAWLFLYLARARVRGDTIASQRDLALTFGVGRQVVRGVIERLEKMANNPAVTHDNPPPTQRGLIINELDVVNNPAQPTSNPAQPKTEEREPSLPLTIPTLEEKEEPKKDKEKTTINSSTKEIEQRQKKFYQSLIPYVKGQGERGIYEPSMVREFYDYWSEPNRSHTKFRMENEKTWDTARRLARWAKGDHSKSTIRSGIILNNNDPDDEY